MIVNFQVEDNASKPRFFEEIFWMTDTKFEVILRIFFLKLSNTNILFDKKILK